MRTGPYRGRAGNGQISCRAGDMLATSYLLLLATDTHPGGQKIRIVSVRVRLGAQPAAVLVGGGRLELASRDPWTWSRAALK